MKDYNKNEEFIEKCRNMDFSSQDTNKEENLQRLKMKLWEINEEKEIIMNKKIKKPVTVIVVAATIMCLSMAVYGQDLIRIIKTVALGDYAHYNVVEDTRESFPVPANLAGQIYDKDGNVLTEISISDPTIYNAKGQEVLIDFDNDTEDAIIVTMDEYKENHVQKGAEFYDMEEGQSHFITETFMPTYLPTGYAFEKISYYTDSIEDIAKEPGANKYMSVYYTNGSDEIFSQVRFMDEETAFEAGGSKDIQELKINGHDAIMDSNNLSIQIDDVMYMFFGNKNLNMDELVKMAESLK